LNGDGYPDIIGTGFGVSGGTVLLLNAGGTFSAPQVMDNFYNWTFGYSWTPSHFLVADLDGDGDPDVIGPGPRILMNTTRQIARGSLARINHPTSLDLYGPPGSPWLLYASLGPASIPWSTWGTVMIDPATAVLFATGSFPPAGVSTLSGFIPNNPALIGA